MRLGIETVRPKQTCTWEDAPVVLDMEFAAQYKQSALLTFHESYLGHVV
jgi:hypothetical protein